MRSLEQREYAYFTIANTMQGTINVLADIGISIGLVSIGGRVWQDRNRFGQLINTALGLRRKLGALAILIVTPLLYFMLVKNGASPVYAAILIAVVLFGLFVQLSLGVLSVVPRLHSDIGRIQTIDLTGAVARLIVLLALVLDFPERRRRRGRRLRDFVFAILDAAKICRSRRRSRGAGERSTIARAMRGFIRNQAPTPSSFACKARSRFS